MRAFLRYPFIIFTIMMIACIASSVFTPQPTVQAYKSSLVPAYHAGSEQAGRVTIIILDMSGSVQYTDRPVLRCSAANAYIDLSRPNDLIGVIALTSGNQPSTTEEHALIWQTPTPVGALSQREQLKQTITQRPPGTPGCQQPFGNTPTYDALRQALNMLKLAIHTQKGELQGSVILLTDGEPTPKYLPDKKTQIVQIEAELIPQFQQHHWSIDTIALGTYLTYLPFLKNIAVQTGGISYDDAEGNVSGQPSSLNITPFFLKIIAQRNNDNRTLSTVIAKTTLSGEEQLHDFVLDNYAKHLDVIVVKDQGIEAKLTSSDKLVTLPSQVPIPNTLVSIDTYYEIFSIDKPLPGDWQLDIRGAGNFLVESLVVSWLDVSIITPQKNSAVIPIGRAFTLSARFIDERNPETPVTGVQKGLLAVISFEGTSEAGTQPFMARIYLGSSEHKDTPGIYQHEVIVPPNATPGTYVITVSVSRVTEAIISSATRTIRLVHFPEPFLVSPQTGQTTADLIKVTILQWDEGLQYLYGNSWLNWFGQLPLQHMPAQPRATISGLILLDHSVYPRLIKDGTPACQPVNGHACPYASVASASLYPKSGKPISVTVINGKNGRFQLELPSLPNGTYTITLKLSGSFEGLSGDLGSTVRTIHLTSKAASSWMSYVAWSITVLYLLILLILLVTLLAGFHFVTGPTPFGEGILSRGSQHYYYPFNKARRSLLRKFWRHTLYSQDVLIKATKGYRAPKDVVKMPPGLRFRFCYGRKIKILQDGPEGAYWRRKDGSSLDNECRKTYVLIYQPRDVIEAMEYTIQAM